MLTPLATPSLLVSGAGPNSLYTPTLKDLMARYTRSATWYDALSAEPIYGAGRKRAIPALHLQEGSRVLDVGCGTGLNFPLLLEAVGESGQAVGVTTAPRC